MRSPRKPRRIFLAGAVWCSLSLGAGAQEAGDAPPPVPSPAAPRSREASQAKLDALVEAFDLTPKPVPEVPDDPPPHEGAMIDQPEYRVEPPDLLLVEVIEALPGRPISGERLVRPDGTISLGFYGDIHVRGLTLQQVKVKVVKHLRRLLSDEVLGLHDARQGWPASLKRSKDASEPDQPDAPAKEGERSSFEIDDPDPAFQDMDEPAWDPAPPELSDRIFVEVTGFNSKNYYVLGDVPAPGRLPTTGNETVLDALQHAGGLLPTADPDNIRLVRPGRGGKPGKVYKVDLEAIRERGETATNYQIFPGDRLVVGRDKIVEKTVEIDRLTTAIKTVFAAMGPKGDLAREMERRGGGVILDEKALRDALIRALQAKPEEPKDGE